MSEIHRLALAALLTGLIASAPAFAQTANAPGASTKSRAAIAAKYNRKMPACKAQAKRDKISISEHRAFMRQCLAS
jgi:psiF repeat-containing protein